MNALSVPALVELTPDERAVAMRHTHELVGAAAHLHEKVKAGTLTEEMRGILLGLCEHELANAALVLGYSSDLAAEVDRRHAELRAANQRVHELEQQLGASRTTDGLSELIQRLRGNVETWWTAEGLGHVPEFAIGGWGVCRVEFSCHLFGPHDGDNPVTAEQNHLAWLASLPYTLYNRGHSELDVLDTDANRSRLVELLTGRFPSLRVAEWKNHVLTGKGEHAWGLRSAVCYIYDLAELEVPAC